MRTARIPALAALLLAGCVVPGEAPPRWEEVNRASGDGACNAAAGDVRLTELPPAPFRVPRAYREGLLNFSVRFTAGVVDVELIPPGGPAAFSRRLTESAEGSVPLRDLRSGEWTLRVDCASVAAVDLAWDFRLAGVPEPEGG